jgi:hypothetical protein
MPGFFDRQSIDICCPKCGQKHSKTIGWLKSHRDIACRCGSNIHLDLKDFLGPLKKAEGAIDSLPREINIKF